MSDNPSDDLVARATAAIAREKRIGVFIDGLDSAFQIDRIKQEGPYVRLTKGSTEWLFRSDRLYGMVIMS